jgi:hypothetical protein
MLNRYTISEYNSHTSSIDTCHLFICRERTIVPVKQSGHLLPIVRVYFHVLYSYFYISLLYEYLSPKNISQNFFRKSKNQFYL